MIPPLAIVARLRPIDLVAPGTATQAAASQWPARLDALAPYVALTAVPGAAPAELCFEANETSLAGRHDPATGEVSLRVTHDGRTSEHRSRRHGTLSTGATVEELGLTLTGVHLTVLTRQDGRWTARGRVGLKEVLDTHDGTWLASLTARGSGVDRLTHGDFGQLGLRDTRLVTHADGSRWSPDGALWFTATHAGPGFFDTAHTGVWRLDPVTLNLTHTGTLFFRRPEAPGVYGDHATHLVRDGDRWLCATSTWGDFDRRNPAVSITLAQADAHDAQTDAQPGVDLVRGRHVLDTRALRLPTDGFVSRGQWDPHLVRIDGLWHVGFASARKFFSFHPALAVGTDLDDLRLRAVAADRRACEGTTLLRLPGDAAGPGDGRHPKGSQWVVLASDGRDGRRGQRAQFPVFDLDLRQVGTLAAPYPTNLPWPTLAHIEDGWVMVTFNGTPAAGELTGYGTHGEVVVMREATDPKP